MKRLFLLVASWASSVFGQPALEHPVLQWIHEAPEGFVHPDQEVRVDPDTGLIGMFATKFIPNGTLLLQVPWDLMILSDDPEEEASVMCCGMVKALANELKKGNASKYAPYVNYLLSKPDNEIPSGWSDMGQKLLRTIVGGIEHPLIPPDDPTEWLTHDWYDRCGGRRADKMSAKAALLVVTRSDEIVMIPGYDLYNHRNGKYLNTDVTIIEGEKQVTIASRDIQPGEQIHNSANKCSGCGGRRIGYGTAEVLRDYGFVEEFPQIWHYQSTSMQFELDVTEDGRFNLTWMYDRLPKNDFRAEDRPHVILWLKRQVRYLHRVRNVDYKDGNPGIPEHEWNTAWEFQKANIRAMTLAIASLEAIESGITDETEMMEQLSHITMEQFETNYSHYDALHWEMDDIDYLTQTCDNKEILKFHDHAVVDEIHTHYQNLNFAIHPGTLDVMMDLDNIVQIASVYRPQYHEYVTHAAARFIPKVERVIFIGGGDSMLLHETLKYPDLKLVVGLELDQTVTRKSFKYFRSSPHFEDPRVEWWFGDATKSLLLLSQEYWQSFDLVLVDLSETVMSLSVTKELDVFDALALLLKHEGVLVKNELYMEPISKVFDYSMDILYDCPIICSQVLAFGSNKVDFFHDPVYDHGIDTFLYKNMHDPYTRHNFAHDFRINNATQQGKCGRLPEVEKLDEQARSAGIVEIVEAEQVSVPLDESLSALFLKVIQDQGFRPLAAPIYDGGMLMIAMKEGYVMARLFPEEKYCNLDIHVWGKFHKLNALRESLTNALGSGLVSRFRIVVGGMYGSDTWPEDREIIGPQIVQTRNCDIPVYEEAPDLTENLITAAIEASMDLVSVTDIVAIVICKDAEDCLATKVVKKDVRVDKVVKISTCPDLVPGDLDKQYACEMTTAMDLKAKLDDEQADLVVVDSSTSYEMFQILNSILSRDDYRKSIIDATNVFMVWSMNAEEEEYQRNFLDRYRKQHEWDPIARAEIWMQDGTKALEFGVLSTEDRQIVYNLADVEANIKARFQGIDNVSIELRGIYGGLYEYQQNFDPEEFLQSDYDTEEGFQHYFDQNPLARHVVFQLEEGEDETFTFTMDSLGGALAKALEAVEFDCATHQSFTGMGEGAIILCMNPNKGSTVLVWDGRKHVDISFYFLDDEPKGNAFIDALLENVEDKLKVALRDDMPRGTGRVINFASDIRSPEELKEFYESLWDLVAKDGVEEVVEEEIDDDDEDDGLDGDDQGADAQTIDESLLGEL